LSAPRVIAEEEPARIASYLTVEAGEVSNRSRDGVKPRDYGAGSLRLQFQIRTPSAHHTRKMTMLAGTQTNCSHM